MITLISEVTLDWPYFPTQSPISTLPRPVPIPLSEGVSLAEARSQLGAGAIPPLLSSAATGHSMQRGQQKRRRWSKGNKKYWIFVCKSAKSTPCLPHPPTAATPLSPPAGHVVDTLPDKSTDRQTGKWRDSDHATEKQKVKVLMTRGKAGGR